MSIFEKAYAKINICLEIKGVLTNGMHSLNMLMQSINLFDEIEISKIEDGIVIEGTDGIKAEDNIAYKAAKLFFEYTGIGQGVLIKINKRIPMMSGMGGGSADAAAVLRGLNRLYDANLSYDELCMLGGKLGADVPFMLKAGCARASGIGEKLEYIENDMKLCWLVAKPFKGVNTAECYKSFDAICGNVKSSINRTENCIKALKTKDIELLKGNIYNDLTKPAIKLLPEIETLLWVISKYSVKAFMTGSGSSCIGMFFNAEDAENALVKIKEEFKDADFYIAESINGENCRR